MTNEQLPVWFKVDERVRIVSLKEIFEEPGYLPTFNAMAIEWCLTNIPGLARYFIYVNDDVFFLRPTGPEYFFGANGLPKLMFSEWPIKRKPEDTTLWSRVLDRQAARLEGRFGERQRAAGAHGPYLLDRERISIVREIWSAEVAATLTHRFRDPENVQLNLMYMNTLHELDQSKDLAARHEVVALGDNELRVIQVGDERYNWRQSFREVRTNPPRFLCLNDDAPAGNIRSVEAAHRALLKSFFPARSPFEKTPDWREFLVILIGRA